MEGAGVAAAAARHGVPFAEVRAISNLVGPRDRAAWRIPEALAALARPSLRSPPDGGRMGSVLLAYSTCPNDTFVFHAWTHGLIEGAPPVEVTYADIDITNTAAERGAYDVAKVSYAALPWLLDAVPAAAERRRAGTRLRPARADPRRASRAWTGAPWPSRPSARPRTCCSGCGPPVSVRPRIDVVPFAEIMPAVRDGRYDAGLVIHEARFVYPSTGSGRWSTSASGGSSDTGLPIPLGAILARRSLDAGAITAAVRGSVEYAWAHPAASGDYVAEHAQEMSPDVQQRHIALYVNEFTRDLGDEGYAAADALLTRAYAAGLIPPLPAPLR